MAGWLDLSIDGSTGEQCLDLGGDAERLSIVVDIEWLDAEVITGEEEIGSFFVSNGEGEHTAEMIYHRLPVFPIGMEQYLRVRFGTKGMALRLQPRTQLAIIVELSIEHSA